MPVLNFKGKSSVYSHHLGAPFRSLEIDEQKSLPPSADRGGSASDAKGSPGLDDNLIIQGDNLHALKALLPIYAGKVKCVYIDPPYNTGNEGWKYNDKVNSPMIKEWLNQNGIGSDDLEKHDKWLCMMWPRLQLLKELLSDDGVIFVSIDDNEQHHLRMIMNEIFGEENFIACFSWQSKYTLANDASKVSYQHENILFYAKNAQSFQIGLFPRTEEMDKAYKNPDNDHRGKWKATPLHAKSGKAEDRYSLTFSNGAVWECPKGRYPRYTKDKLLALYNEGKLYFGKSGQSSPNRKTYLSKVKTGKTVGSFWSYEEAGSTHEATEELAEIFEKGKFSNPKGTKLLKRIIQAANTPPDGVILDSFAGSGTTAHAVLDLNKEDGGRRKFILVECEDYADGITAERVRRVIKGVPKAKDERLKGGLGGSFTYCSLGEEINEEKLIKGKSLPSYKVLAGYIYWTATGCTLDKVNENEDFYIGKTAKNTAFFVIYKPSVKFLRSKECALNLDRKEKIQEIMRRENCKKAVVFAPVHYFDSSSELAREGILFCQLPFSIYRIAGV